jgi:hypothetical protein
MEGCQRLSTEAPVNKDYGCKFRIPAGESLCGCCGHATAFPIDIRKGNDFYHQTSILTGEEIRFLREAIRFDRRTFAHIFDISESYLARIENGTEEQSILLDLHIREVYGLAQHGPIL